MKRPRIRVLALIVAAFLVMTACGDDDGGADAKPKVAALFTQFVDQGNWDPAGKQAYDLMCTKYDFECTFTHSSTSYTGTMSALSKKRNLEEGGFFPEFDANIELKASDFCSAPTAGQKITMTSCFDTGLERNGLSH